MGDGKTSIDAEREQRREWLKTLSPEELQALRTYAWDRLLKARKVNIDGKTVSLKAVKDKVVQEKEKYDRGVYDESVRSIPRWKARELMNPHELRPGAFKQMLRDEDEASLELEKMGNGIVMAQRKLFGKTIPGRKDCAYGIYARPGLVQAALQSKWAGKDPSKVLQDQQFYSDLVKECHNVEMTLIVLPSRPLPLAELQPLIKDKLQQGMQRLAGGQLKAGDKNDIESFTHLFNESRLAPTGWVDKGNIVQGTHLIFSAPPTGGLAVEAITPGPLAQRQATYVGVTKNSLLARAVFDAFLGEEPVDDYGKQWVGHGALWFTNGLRLTGATGANVQPGVVKNGQLEFEVSGETEQLPQTTEIFKILDQQDKPMLLRSIRAARKEARQQSLETQS